MGTSAKVICAAPMITIRGGGPLHRTEQLAVFQDTRMVADNGVTHIAIGSADSDRSPLTSSASTNVWPLPSSAVTMAHGVLCPRRACKPEVVDLHEATGSTNTECDHTGEPNHPRPFHCDAEFQ